MRYTNPRLLYFYFTIERMQNFPPHLIYVPTLPENTLPTRSYTCRLPVTICVALKITDKFIIKIQHVDDLGELKPHIIHCGSKKRANFGGL